MPRKRKSPTYLTLSPEISRMAKMEAARRGGTVSDYVTTLVQQDCQRTGVADLAIGAHTSEARHER